MLGSGISLIWCHFYSCLLSNWLFAAKFSNCSNSLNFEAKINCNTIKPNVPKWRKTCTGLKFDLLHFCGPQSHLLSGDTFEGPCTSAHSYWKASLLSKLQQTRYSKNTIDNVMLRLASQFLRISKSRYSI